MSSTKPKKIKGRSEESDWESNAYRLRYDLRCSCLEEQLEGVLCFGW